METRLNQQINLYQPQFRLQPTILSPMMMASICMLVLLMLIGSGGYGWLGLNDQRGAVLTLQLQHEKLQKQLQALGADRNRGLSVDDHISSLEARLFQRVKSAESLKTLLSGRNMVPAQYQALSRVQVPGLWLTAILLGEENELHGYALDDSLIPRYLKALSTESAFAELRFDEVVLNHEVEAPAQVRFVLRGRRDQLELL